MAEIILSEMQAAMIVAGIDRRDRLRQASQKQEAALIELARTYARMAGLEGERVQVRQDDDKLVVVVLDEPQEDSAETEAEQELGDD